MVVPTRKRTQGWHTIASHFLFLHLYLRLHGTKVSSPLLLSLPDLRFGNKSLFPEHSDFAYGHVGRKVLCCVLFLDRGMAG